ncbi:hypothetical protein TraAM80_10177 [Trypanosoma rangeli]|uniref:Uncharacterized protein n=1 Tax=Trypanosoma rangeli TaxID=5698 RepID=A0A3R7M3P3_TRYRA|nr:uncharacterized protein TraAM80_10177 [Trypanosoma rangeli]RNE95572.1 hypothetical protein TraAM80_10177 [Trypanosoma rangeli]|eukprot:RNE95572.1 hypothetical protein TraAM80_10177 [Trypanosoma rangeli]
MGVIAQSVHPSLQRYLPGHLPKRQRRLHVGKTNGKEFEDAHVADVENEVVPHLKLPNRLVQSLLLSPTVTRTAAICGNETRLGTSIGYQDNSQSSRISEQVSLKHRRNDAAQMEETSRSLLASNTAGRNHYFTEETFYIGYPNLGGAGQLLYNDPSDPHSCNPTVSARNTRKHHSPELWFAKATQHPTGATPQTQLSRLLTASAKNDIPQNNTLDGKTPAKYSDSEAQLLSTNIKPGAQNGYCTKKISDGWPQNYTPPDVYDVPPPKLRYELTDYHTTFHHTNGLPNSIMYISEKERLQSIQHIPLPTPTNIALCKPGRRRYPCK